MRQVTGEKKNSPAICVESKADTIIMEQGEILKRWEEYIGERIG